MGTCPLNNFAAIAPQQVLLHLCNPATSTLPKKLGRVTLRFNKTKPGEPVGTCPLNNFAAIAPQQVLLHKCNPATSASGERSFSTGRRIKSWLRAKMSQKHFNHVALLNTHETRTDNLRLVNVANEFTARNENRKRNVGTFTVQDLLP